MTPNGSHSLRNVAFCSLPLEARGSGLFFHPADIPVLSKLAAVLAEDADHFESKMLVDGRRCSVRERIAGYEAVDVFTALRFE
jgi:hypothetical protein